MNGTERTLVALIKSALKSEKYISEHKFSSEEISNVYNESIAQTVPLLAYGALTDVSKSIIPEFEKTALNVAANNIRITLEHIAIGRALEEKNIPYCILKGYASSY